MTARQIGDIGEQAVCDYLTSGGWRIATRNFTVRGGEIDIIAEKDDIIAFVEVKSRDENAMDSGFLAVTKTKRTRIIKTAQHYLYKHECDLQPRFDVAAVKIINSQVNSIDYIENAFDMSDTNIIF